MADNIFDQFDEHGAPARTANGNSFDAHNPAPQHAISSSRDGNVFDRFDTPAIPRTQAPSVKPQPNPFDQFHQPPKATPTSSADTPPHSNASPPPGLMGPMAADSAAIGKLSATDPAANKIGKAIFGAEDVGATVASRYTPAGLLPMVVGGLAGLGSAATGGDAVKATQKAEQALSYEPSSAAGKVVAAPMDYVAGKLAEGGGYLGKKMLDATGSPALATAVDTATQALPLLLGERAIRGGSSTLADIKHLSSGDPAIDSGVARDLTRTPAPETESPLPAAHPVGTARGPVTPSPATPWYSTTQRDALGGDVGSTTPQSRQPTREALAQPEQPISSGANPLDAQPVSAPRPLLHPDAKPGSMADAANAVHESGGTVNRPQSTVEQPPAPNPVPEAAQPAPEQASTPAPKRAEPTVEQSVPQPPSVPWINAETGEIRPATDDEIKHQFHRMFDAAQASGASMQTTAASKMLADQWGIPKSRLVALRKDALADRKEGMTTDQAAQAASDSLHDAAETHPADETFQTDPALRRTESAAPSLGASDAAPVMAQSDAVRAPAANSPAAPSQSVRPVVDENGFPLNWARQFVLDESGKPVQDPKQLAAWKARLDEDAKATTMPATDADAAKKAEAATTPPENEPGQPLHPWTPVDTTKAVAYAGGVSTDGRRIHLDPNMPKTVQVEGKTIDAHDAVAYHESIEYPLMHLSGKMTRQQIKGVRERAGGGKHGEIPKSSLDKLARGESLTYPEAHHIATLSENHRIRTLYGVDPEKYQAALKDGIEAARAKAEPAQHPADLDAKPYVDMGEEHLLTTGPLAHGDRVAVTAGTNAGKQGEVIGRGQRGGIKVKFDNGKTAALSRQVIERAKPLDRTLNPFDSFDERGEFAPARATDSNAFHRFFDGSKVTQGDGSPRIVYHGTGEGFTVFDNSRLGENTGHMTAPLGHFLTESRPEARRYAKKAANGVPADERVIASYVSIKNPKPMTLDQFLAIDSHGEARALRAKLEREGYDGIKLDANGKTQWVAFESGQIKDVNNLGTWDRGNPDIRYQRSSGESRPVLAKEEVHKLAAGVLGMNPDDAGVHVIDSAEQLPQAVKDHMQAVGIPPEEVHAVHHRGNTYLVADKIGGAEGVQEAIFHEHYTHGGLRARYGNKLGDKLTELVRGVGGMDGIRRMAKEQGIDLSHYEATTLDNPRIPEKQQHLILMEELLAHMSKLTGTLKRTVQEWVGALRDFLRRNGFAKLAEYGETDLAHVLKQARETAIARTDASGKSRPLYMRVPTDRTPAATAQSALPPRRPGEAHAAYLRRIGGSEDVKAATSLRTQQKQIGRHAIREMLAKRSRAMDTADAVFSEYRKLFDRTDPGRNLANVDDWEAGRPVRDPPFRAFLSKMQAGFDERIARLHQLDPDALRNLIEHYLPHLYKDPARAAGVFSSFVDRHSIAGDKSFLKPRSWPTLREAMESGLAPITTNPVDWVLAKYASMDKYAGMLELRKELGERGWLPKVRADEQPPFGFKRVADPAFNGVAVPETLARDITNYLDPGLSKYAAWRSLRGAQNFMVAADLGFSGFHAVFTSTDNVIMHLDVAARRAAIRDSRGAAATLVKALASVATSPFEGHKLNQQWRGIREADANTAAILDALERGGARWKMSTTEYQNAIPKLARLFRQMMGAGVLAHARGMTPTELAVGAIKVPATMLQAAAETGSYLIHHVLVPNQKMAARVLLYKYELDRHAHDLGRSRGDYAGIIDAMHPDVVRQLAAQVNDVVDFRLGQMTYDNRFWNRTVQDVAQAAVMAPGWQYGMLQTVLGAGKAVKDIVSPTRLVAPLDKAGAIADAHMGRVGSNLSYFLTLALTLGGSMAALQYMLTGKGPDELKDYFFPKTGRRNEDDSDERLQFPNYWVDHFKLVTEPARTAQNKIHPLWKMVWEIGHNRDYFGTQIRSPDAPALEQAKQIGEYLASKFVPITVGNIRRGMERDESTAQHVGHFFGINNAPLGVARSTFQNFVMQGGSKGWGNYTKTPEEAQRRLDERAAAAAIRRGDQPNLDNLAPDERAKARKDARQPVPALLFKKLSDTDKLRAWELATPEERERYGLRATIGRMHLERSAPFRRLPPEQQAQFRQRLQNIRTGGQPQPNPFDQFDGR